MKTPDAALDKISEDRDRVLAQQNVSRETIARLNAFVGALLTWQAKTNLIAPSTISEVWTRHIADSLQLVKIAPEAKIWVDLGSGGGFPGLVIACALDPSAKVHLVESNSKKAAFLREAARLAPAPTAVIHAQRIEDFLQQFQGVPDVVMARALAPLPKLLEYVAPLVEKGAKALLLKGQDIADELTEASKYWKVEAELVPSQTDSGGRIVIVRELQRVK